jgi:hypothetical protein
MSLYANQYLEIAARITAHFTVHPSVQITKPLWIDLWNNHLANLRDDYPIPFPAIFINFEEVQWRPATANGGQLGDAIIAIHVCWENYADSYHNLTGGSTNQSTALAMFDFVENVHLAMQGYAGTHFTALQRIRTATDADHDMLIDTVIYYATTLADCALANANAAQYTTTTLTDATVTPNTVPAPLVQPSILAAGDSPFVI